MFFLVKDPLGKFTPVFLLASTFNCQKCHTSNYRRCDDSTDVDTCGMHDTQCFSLLYTSTEKVQGKDVEVNGFEKGCLPANENCETYCQLYMKYGYKDCKVDILGPYNPLSQCLVGLTIFNGVVFGHKFFTEVTKEDHSGALRPVVIGFKHYKHFKHYKNLFF